MFQNSFRKKIMFMEVPGNEGKKNEVNIPCRITNLPLITLKQRFWVVECGYFAYNCFIIASEFYGF
jgi:hypothetical protein